MIQYYYIQSWMTTELNLKGLEKEIFAIIYGFQVNNQECHCSLSEFAKTTGYSIRHVVRALKRLIDDKYIIKEEIFLNNLKFCKYKINKGTDKMSEVVTSCQGGNDILSGGVMTSCHKGTDKMSYNNILNNIDNNIDIVVVEKEKLYGEYQNVFLSESNYNKLLGISLSKKLLEETIDNLSSKIEEGAEQPYKSDCPNAHFIRLKKYIDYRRKHPEKFKEQEEFNPYEVGEYNAN